MVEDEGFLQRWARRKAEARAEPRPEPAMATAAAVDAPAPAPPADAPPTAAPPGREAPVLPDLDSLGPDSDYRSFMLPGVPGELRRAALRKLWRSDPVYANLDGLVDFGEDWTDQARVVAGLKTTYRVGRGLLAEPARPEPAASDEPAQEPDAEDGGETADPAPDGEPDSTRA